MKRIVLAGLALLLTACSTIPFVADPGTGQTVPGGVLPTAAGDSPTPFQPVLPTLPFPTPEDGFISPDSTPYVLTIYLHPALDGEMPPFLSEVNSPDAAMVAFDLTREDDPLYAVRTYAFAAPFPTIEDEISRDALIERWTSGGRTLVLTPATAALLRAAWGDGGEDALIVSRKDLADTAWETRRYAILPFDELGPRWKVLLVDGRSPMRKDFNPAGDPLTFKFTLRGDPRIVEALTAMFGPDSPAPLTSPTNRNPAKLTTVALTGVTALVRATAYTMEQRGLTYPARDIGDWLREADILHISNEVPFAQDCPFPDPLQGSVKFCSDPRYIELLDDIGTDIVELTGDHFHDWGSEAMLYTLELYKARGWPVYGGGANYAAGKQAALLEHNGNRIAFIGCNGKGPVFARATETNPGSVQCDMKWATAETERLTDAGYLVIATFQHNEYYTYEVPAPMLPDFRAMADAGAVIVSGSQAHHPHGFEFRENALIHFGLGNLFFDQLGINLGTEQGFIDRHIFYDGRYLGVELLTIRFEDYARSRPMTPEERADLLRSVFQASGW